MNSAGVMRSSESFESGDMPGVNQAFLTFPLTIPLRPGICPDYAPSTTMSDAKSPILGEGDNAAAQDHETG